MSLKKYNEEDIQAIADAIRLNLNFIDTYTIEEMPQAINYLMDNYDNIFQSLLINKDTLINFSLPVKTEYIKPVLAMSPNLTTVTLPDSVTHIGVSAFLDCPNLTTINLPDGLTHIGDSAFLNCSNLTTINLPDGLTHIGDSAFLNCSNLTTINLPDSITHIEPYAFSGCANLNNINLPDGLTHIESYTFYKCSNLTTVTLPDGVTHIGDSAFNGCPNLNNINLPDSITHIGSSIFSLWSPSQPRIFDKLPNSLIYIGDYGLTGTTLNSQTLPKNLKHIGNHAFMFGSTSISEIPENVEYIGDGIFHMTIIQSDTLTFRGTPQFISPFAFEHFTTINVPWSEGEVANAPWGATNATVNYNYTGE